MSNVHTFRYLLLLTATLTLCVQPIACKAVRAEEMRARQESIPDTVWKEMQGRSWRLGLKCPARQSLVLLTLPYLDFEGEPKLGQMIVSRKVANTVMAVFTTIFKSKVFRIQRMELIDKFEGDDAKSMAANNTSAFNCRLVTGGKRLSSHAFGTAIDINPVQNPWVSKSDTEPSLGKSYNTPGERSGNVIGIIRSDGLATKTFKQHNWGWGGDWKSLKDYQHFSKDGR